LKHNPNRDEVRRLQVERQRLATELYGHKAWLGPEQNVRNLRHKALEKQFNDVARQIHILRGKPESEFRARRDVRHEFRFETQTHQTRRGTYRVEGVEGPIYHPDSVINWRRTRVGRQVDQQLRSNVRRTLGASPGDDVGHRLPLSAGVDPGERRNVGLQNFQQNQAGGTWHVHETILRQWLRNNEGRHLEARVNETFHDHPSGRTRSLSRKISVEDNHGGMVMRNNVFHANPRFENRVRVAPPSQPHTQTPSKGNTQARSSPKMSPGHGIK